MPAGGPLTIFIGGIASNILVIFSVADCVRIVRWLKILGQSLYAVSLCLQVDHKNQHTCPVETDKAAGYHIGRYIDGS